MASSPDILFISHGGGPLPLLGDPAHADMVAQLARLAAELPRPDAIVLISAHWEENEPTVTAGATPGLIYDYYGFPPESYAIDYPCPGEPALAQRVQQALVKAGLPCRQDPQRGFDHGLFVPLKIMYPDANVKNQAFEHWLEQTCCDATLSEAERRQRLQHWEQAPYARFCHPREEHLLPLQVCAGLAGRACDRHLSLNILGKQSGFFCWHGNTAE
ncbi:class III extradiol ring-cleavage dioxygenase [Oceanimonas sp. CHS3-5]|uniref:DODA-type extradiol aromatic ring-opening family dioxygenase n=1 Tax=Oceanimonas sp. CHS3-5 TaxID=3068186 RepID=UPI00273FCA8E|nr:class III extradiol ring-cleavage dioxygenase [Oceanimonas sp. CHS3-5]MDP5291557.1 class III extradiol ring-cleavage dioxygenase [Oceanimonas sp. CHS3-5]